MIAPEDLTGPPALFAVDWGTSSCRVWALDDGGGALASSRSGDGMLAVLRSLPARAGDAERAAAFAEALDRIAGPALAAWPDVPVVCCGMAGAAGAWAEAGYTDPGAELDRAAHTLARADLHGRPVWIVPGIRQAATAATPYPDVIRGEETQVLGVVELLGTADARTVVVPGTHSKWIRVRSGAVESFATVMTGDLFAAVLRETIIGVPAAEARTADAGAFRRGLLLARDRPPETPLAGLLFSARTLVGSGELPAGSVADFVSGLLIGDEVTHRLSTHSPGEEIVLCGDADICLRYRTAITEAGSSARVLGEDATTAGIASVARTAGLVGTRAVTR